MLLDTRVERKLPSHKYFEDSWCKTSHVLPYQRQSSSLQLWREILAFQRLLLQSLLFFLPSSLKNYFMVRVWESLMNNLQVKNQYFNYYIWEYDINAPIIPVQDPFSSSIPNECSRATLNVKFSFDWSSRNISAKLPWKQLAELHPSLTTVNSVHHGCEAILSNTFAYLAQSLNVKFPP